MKIKRVIYTILLILWMLVIFMFSNQNGTKSESTSDKVTSTIIGTAEVVTKQEINEEKKNNIIEDSRVFIRKSAHFFLYFILGILSYLTFRSYNINKRILFYSVTFCFVYAVSDEIHQIFSSDRTFKILDIFIDTIGGLFGGIICLIINKFIR